MKHCTVNISGQETPKTFIFPSRTRPDPETAADFSSLMDRANAVAYEVAAALDQILDRYDRIIDQYEALARDLGVEL